MDDHVSDANGAELHRLNQLYAFPAFVKRADAQHTLRPGSLPATVYADELHHAYPCHNAAATWLSALFLAEKAATDQFIVPVRVRQRLDRFVASWGVKAAVDAMRQRCLELHKQADDALPDEAFAVVWQEEGGRKERHCRMASTPEVKAAADWLARYRDQLPFADRHTVATKILQKAAQFGASLGEHEEFVQRQAGQGLCDPKALQQLLLTRVKLAKTAEQRQVMTKLAVAVASQPSATLHPLALIKLAGLVDGFDRVIGLAGKYTPTLPRPEDVIFQVTHTQVKAAADDAVATNSGRIYSKADLTKLALGDIEAVFGDLAKDVADGLNLDPEKFASVLQTLPLPDAEEMDRLLDRVGIPPVSVKRAAARPLKELAAAY